MKNFGFELEFKQAIRDRNHMLEICMQAMRDAGYENESDNFSFNENVRNWTLKTDHCGWEITSPILASNADNLIMVHRWIDKLGEKMSKFKPKELFYHSTGLHVHIDVKHLNRHSISDALRSAIKFEPALVRLNDKIRMAEHEHVYALRELIFENYDLPRNVRLQDIADFLEDFDFICDRKNLKDLEKIKKAIDEYGEKNGIFYNQKDMLTNNSCFTDHDSACNYTCHESLEFRHGLATFKGNDVKNWIACLIFLVDASIQNPIKRLTSDDVKCSYLLTPNEFKTNVRQFIDWLRQSNYSKPWMQGYQRNLIRWINQKSSGSWTRTHRNR